MTDKFMLRMPDGMRQRLKAMAALNRRSLNSELVFHLDRILGSAAAATGDEIGVMAPAAAQNTAALQGGDIINPGI